MSQLYDKKKELAKKIQANHRLPPITHADMVLSRKHLKDGAKYNLRHFKDHMKLATYESKNPKAVLYNLQHAKGHLEAAEVDQKLYDKRIGK